MTKAPVNLVLVALLWLLASLASARSDAKAQTPTVEQQLELLDSDDKQTRRRAAATLIDLAPGIQGTAEIQALLQAMRREPDAPTRRLIVLTFSVLGPRTPEVLPALIEALEDWDPQVRLAAANVLGLFGPKARDALPTLNRRIGDEPDPDVVRGFAQAILEIGAEVSPPLR